MKTIVVVPCYNEAERLDVHIGAAVTAEHVSLLFVDDGSTDQTAEAIKQAIARTPHRLLQLEVNRGKAEAVRAGMTAALEENADCVGYWDADGATPFGVINDFVDVMQRRPDLHLLMGSRVRMLGRRIDRRTARHYGGRVIATIVSLILRLPVYDTQCGAKLLRATPELTRALAAPFTSRWLFDVELIARIRQENGWSPDAAENHINEYPLMQWRDVGASRIRLRDFVLLPFDLLKLWVAYR